VTERGGRSGAAGSGRHAADASAMTATDDDADGNETMSVVSNCSDLQTAAQLTDGKCSVVWCIYTIHIRIEMQLY